MRRIKKKDLRRYHYDRTTKAQSQEEDSIEELVDTDGSPIEGDRNPVSNSEIEVSPGQTTDDFVDSARQPNMGYDGMYGMGGGYSHGKRYVAAESAMAKVILSKILKENK